MRELAMLCAVALVGCGGGEGPDAGADGSVEPMMDADVDGGLDAGGLDAGGLDAGGLDAGSDGGLDASPLDASPLDASSLDAAVLDAGDLDAGDLDAEIPDAGDTDAGDAGPVGDADDPFDVGVCTGTPWTESEARAYVPNSGDRIILATDTLLRRTRGCRAIGDCDPWNPASDWTIAYLEYSGGSTTRWVDVLMTMQLVLFNDGGTARLSMQHTTFDASGSTLDDSDGVVYDIPSPSTISYPHLRAWNVTATGSDYEELDYTVVDGAMELGEDCARWTSWPFGTGEPYGSQHGGLFRW